MSASFAEQLAAFRPAFSGEVITPTDGAEFNKSTTSWGVQNKKQAQAVLRPATVDDVSKAVKWLASNKIDFAVRSGGMSYSQSEGVVIDLAKLNKVEYDAKDNTVVLGPGQTWSSVYGKLASTDVTVLGGRVGSVGVGGFILGGGISYLAHEHGLASDSLVDAEVVLANGEVVRAKDDADLMFALKGAGNKFGVVTEFVLRAFPKPKRSWSGVIAFTMDKFDALTEAISTFHANNRDPGASLLFVTMRQPPEYHPACVIAPLLTNGTEKEGQEVFKWALDLGPVANQTKEMTWEEVNAMQGESFLGWSHSLSTPSNVLNAFMHTASPAKLTVDVFKAALKWQEELIGRDPRFMGTIVLVEPMFKGAFANFSNESSAFPHGDPQLNVFELLIVSPDPSINALVPDALLDGEKRITEAAGGKSACALLYPNYSLAGVPASEYYGQNLGRLERLKAKYDPENVFNKGIQISPA